MNKPSMPLTHSYVLLNHLGKNAGTWVERKGLWRCWQSQVPGQASTVWLQVLTDYGDKNSIKGLTAIQACQSYTPTPLKIVSRKQHCFLHPSVALKGHTGSDSLGQLPLSKLKRWEAQVLLARVVSLPEGKDHGMQLSSIHLLLELDFTNLQSSICVFSLHFQQLFCS